MNLHCASGYKIDPPVPCSSWKWKTLLAQGKAARVWARKEHTGTNKKQGQNASGMLHSFVLAFVLGELALFTLARREAFWKTMLPDSDAIQYNEKTRHRPFYNFYKDVYLAAVVKPYSSSLFPETLKTNYGFTFKRGKRDNSSLPSYFELLSCCSSPIPFSWHGLCKLG